MFATLKTMHLDTAIQRAESEFFTIKANVNAGKRIFSPTVQQYEYKLYQSPMIYLAGTD